MAEPPNASTAAADTRAAPVADDALSNHGSPLGTLMVARDSELAGRVMTQSMEGRLTLVLDATGAESADPTP